MSAYTERLKRDDPLKLRAQRLRQDWRKRSKLPVPSSSEIEAWLKGQPLVCAYTDRPVTPATLQVDHRQPLERGGTNDLANLAIVHRDANAEKGTMTEGEFRSLLALMAGWQDGGRKVLQRLRQSGMMFARRR